VALNISSLDENAGFAGLSSFPLCFFQQE